MQEEVLLADEAVARAEHEREAPCPEQDAAEAGVDDPFEEDVDRLTRPGKTGLEAHEAGLHEEHQERRNDRPHRVHRIHVSGYLGSSSSRGVVRKSRRAEVVTDELHRHEQDRHAEQLAGEENCEEFPGFLLDNSLFESL